MSDEAYGGLPGAVVYAFRASDSLCFRAYVALMTPLAVLVGLLFTIALIVLLGKTVGVGGGTFSFSRAFFVVVGLSVVVPLLAPVLFVARQRRRGTATRRSDAALALAGVVFVGALYLGLVVSEPGSLNEYPTVPATVDVALPVGTLALPTAWVGDLLTWVLSALYGLPRLAGVVPPLVGALGIWVLGRRGAGGRVDDGGPEG